MQKSHDKIAHRLALILTKLNNGERFSANELAEEFNVNIRTIQRDLNERFSYLPIAREGDFYYIEAYALGKLNFEDIKNFATISGIKSLYPSLSNDFIVDILNNKINKAYLVKHQSFEGVKDKEKDFELLSAAIVNNAQISFEYTNKNRITKPYKLININGVWYLAADEDGNLKTYTFSKISKICVLDETFTPNKEFMEKMEKNENNWFAKDAIEVVLSVSKQASEYFLRKQVLLNSKILENTDERLLISTKVTYEDEIINTVKYWIPYIKIVSPIYLQERLNNIIKEYLG